MRWGTLLRLFFILYCVEAGVFLVMAPWSVTWDRSLVNLPFAVLRSLGLNPFTRGAVTGFGLVHLLWGAHDLEVWLSRRRSDGQPAS